MGGVNDVKRGNKRRGGPPKKEEENKNKPENRRERETENREEGRELFGHFKYRNPLCSKTISGPFTLDFILSVYFLFCCEYRFSNGFMFRNSEIYNFSYELNSF